MGRVKRVGARKTITKIITVQSVFTVLAALIAIAIADAEAAFSAFVGGMISIIATGYFASRVFSVEIGAPAAEIAKAFYVGETVKMLLTAVLFVIAIVLLKITFLPAFLTYAATLLAYWLILPFSFDTSMRAL